MTTMTIGAAAGRTRVARSRRLRDVLAQAGASPGPRMQRHLVALRQHEAHARALNGEARHEADGTLAQLEARLADRRPLAGCRRRLKAGQTYTVTVEEELHN